MTYNESQEFEWDDSKAESNFKKHGVRFTEATTVWLDESGLEILDLEHSTSSEERWIRMGYSNRTRVLVVIYCEKVVDERIRIISARPATKNEQEQYHLR